MVVFSITDRVLVLTEDALFDVVVRTSEERAALSVGGASIGPLGVLLAFFLTPLIGKVIGRTKDKGLQPEQNLDLKQLARVVDCRVIDLPESIRNDPKWPKVRAGAKVQVVPRRGVREIKLSAWTGLNLATLWNEEIKFPLPFWRVGKMRKALADLGYPPPAA